MGFKCFGQENNGGGAGQWSIWIKQKCGWSLIIVIVPLYILITIIQLRWTSTMHYMHN